MQRGFAGAVRAHKSDAIARRDHPLDSFKKEFVSKAFSGGRQLNHAASIVSRRMGFDEGDEFTDRGTETDHPPPAFVGESACPEQ